MWDVKRLAGPMCAVALVGVTACGSDGEPASVATEPDTVVTEVETDGTEPTGMTIAALCDPLDDVVVDWVGSDVEREHMDLFAADDPASLTCEWQGAPEYREVRITFHASPAVWDATAASGGESLDSVEADNVYDGEILSVRAENGWTIDVVAFEGDPAGYADAPDVIAPIANAALRVTS